MVTRVGYFFEVECLRLKSKVQAWAIDTRACRVYSMRTPNEGQRMANNMTIAELVQKGYTAEQIARVVAVRNQTGYGYKPAPKPLTEEQKDKAEQMAEDSRGTGYKTTPYTRVGKSDTASP